MPDIKGSLVAVRHSATDKGLLAVLQYGLTADPGDILLSEAPLMAVEPLSEEDPILQLDRLDPSLPAHTLAAAVEYFSAPREVQQRVSALHSPENILDHPSASAVHAACGVLQEAGLLSPSADPEHFTRVYCIFALNGRSASDGSLCLYEVADRINHSCRPNAMHSNGVVRAICEISCGEEVTVSYLDDDALLLPTPVRQNRLHATWLFSCTCEQCAADIDKSRAYCCTNCKGPVWPPTPLDGPQHCQCAACGQEYPDALNCTPELLLTDSLPWLNSVGDVSMLVLLEQVCYEQLVDLLNSPEAKALHTTHWLISLLHFMCGLECLTQQNRKSTQAIGHFRVRVVALQALFGDAVMSAQACVWEYLGDANVADGNIADASAAEALQCYETSWRLTSLLFGKKHEETRMIRHKVKKMRKQVAQLELTAAAQLPQDPAVEEAVAVLAGEGATPIAESIASNDKPRPSTYDMSEIEDGERSPGGTLQFASSSFLDLDDDALVLDTSSDEYYD